MNDHRRESAEPTLEQMVQRYREMKQRGKELVARMHQEAIQRDRNQQELGRSVIAMDSRADIEQGHPQRLHTDQLAAISYTELPQVQPNSQLGQEWNFYRREVGRLLAEGEEGRFVLIKGEEIIGIWSTQEEAEAVAFHKYPLEPRLIHQVQRWERVLRCPSRVWRCPG
jgi:hypothetical protein